MSFPLTPGAISILENVNRDVFATRYLSAAGLVVLLYDHVLTLPDEIALIWNSPPSFAKYAFILNRYLVPVALTGIAFEMCGLSGFAFTDGSCRFLIIATAMLAVISLGLANILVLMRVVMLWDHNIVVKRLISGGFAVTFCATFTLMVFTAVEVSDGIRYGAFAAMCVVTTPARSFIGVWASPMAFEVLVLLLTIWNIFDRPRMANLRVASALHRDGITFFMVLTILRTINLALAITNNPNIMLLAVFFVWAMTTLVLNRSLLHVRRVEVLEAFAIEWPHVEPSDILSHSLSPFGLPPTNLEDWELGEEIQEEELKLPPGYAPDILRQGKPLVVELGNFVSWQEKGGIKQGVDSRWF